MRLLLDSHVVLWLLLDDRRLTAGSRALLGASESECYVSAATWWELVIKQSRGVASFSLPISEIRAAAQQAGLRELSVTALHTLCVAELPMLHRDPFDRMLVAQALSEPMRLVTADDAVAAYGPACGVLVERV